MATYYKYQNPSEIGAAPTLDWGTVINDVNKTLQSQEQQRYENREFDKKITNDILTKVNEVVLTSDPNLNALVTNMSYDAKRNIFELKKKLEAGEISRSDFNIATQNTTSSVAQLNQFTKTYGADYDKYLKDVQEGKTSAYADFMQKWKGGFQNFKNKKLIHNPTDGRLYVAQLDETGNVVPGDLGLVPMSTLTEVKNFNDSKIDVLAETNRYAKQFEPFIQMVRIGKVETRQQIENYPGFKDLVNNITEAIAKNDKGYASILTDTDGTYTITGDNQSSGKNIGLKNNGAGEMIPIIDDDMKTRAREVVKEYIIAQTGIKETGTAVFAPQAPRVGGGDKKKTPDPIFGKAMFITKTSPTGKKYSDGVSQAVGNVSFSGGKGIEHVVEKIGYEKGKLFLQGYTITGKESSEGFGDETSKNVVKRDNWGNVIPGKFTEDKKPVKSNKITSDKNADIIDMYVRQIPNPSSETGEKFSGIEEAEQYYSDILKQGKSSAKGSGKKENLRTKYNY
jgi:hypothetical protein